MHKEELSFICTVAHELKAPIITIEGFLNALSEDFDHDLPDGAKEYLHYMDNAVRKLKSIINDLLSLSKLSHEAGKKEKFPIKDVINDTLIRMKPLIQKRTIKVTVHKDLPLIYGDKKQIALIIENLISNAIKYIGKDNPDPRIEIGVTDNKQTIFIRDNGIGIEKRYQDRVFDIFERTPAGRKETEGTGIGLFIVKSVLEEHGGKIWLESCHKKGTTFYIHFPEGSNNGSTENNDNR